MAIILLIDTTNFKNYWNKYTLSICGKYFITFDNDILDDIAFVFVAIKFSINNYNNNHNRFYKDNRFIIKPYCPWQNQYIVNNNRNNIVHYVIF